MKSVKLWGYTIYENGVIIGLEGKEIKKRKQISINWGKKGKKRTVSYARFVYYAFNFDDFDFDNKIMVVKHINKDENDCNINNLMAINKKFLSHGEYSSCSKLTNKEVEEIKEMYSKKDNSNKNNPITNISYRKIAELYGISHSMVAGIIKGRFRNEDNYIIK